MKTFITAHTGGEPIVLDDLRWLTEGLTDSYQSMIKSIVPDDVVTILYGCDRTDDGTHINISAGFISFSGETYRVPAHSVLIVPGDEYWKFEEVFDPNGLKAYAAPGVSHDTYKEVLYSIGISDTPPVDATLFANTKKYIDYVTEGIVKDTWKSVVSVTLGSGSSFPGTYTIKCYRDLDGFVHLQGKFPTPEDSGSGAVDILVGTLPASYRPAQTTNRVIMNIQNILTGELGSIFIEISTTGEIRIKSLFTGFQGVFDYGQVVPFKV